MNSKENTRERCEKVLRGEAAVTAPMFHVKHWRPGRARVATDH